LKRTGSRIQAGAMALIEHDLIRRYVKRENQSVT
jgi:hypothetical protein